MKAHRSYRYRVVDVFTTKPLQGNPLAVFPDSSGLTAETMQKIALELNLSETVFVVPSSRSECVARLRIFTPGKEMDFAGHPTVGAAYILLDEGKVSEGTGNLVVGYFILRRLASVRAPWHTWSMKLKRNSRPSDVNQAAYVMVERSTAEPELKPPQKRKIAKSEISRVMSAMGKKGGKIGGKASLVTMTPEERRERALQAAKARWKKR
jgi:hypothetical protein